MGTITPPTPPAPTPQNYRPLYLGLACVVVLLVGVWVGRKSASPTSPSHGVSSTGSASVAEEASPSPAKPLETVSLSGTGHTATRLFALERGLYVFRFTHNGTSNFIVYLLNSNGGDAGGGSLVNAIGPFSGSKAVTVKRQGQYLLDIDADGSWTVVMGPPS